MPNLSARRHAGWVSVAAWLICVSGLASATAMAALPDENAESWSLRKETDNIRVYTIDQPDSAFKAFKAEALLDAPIENVMAVMINPQSCVEWVHNCSKSHAFGDGNFHDRYAYSVNDMPWPVADRDYVLRIQTRGHKASGEVMMNLNATPNRRDEQKKYVRVDRSDTLYRFVPKGDKTHMIWLQHTDPNGSIPGWLVNTLLVDIPIRSMEQLERVAHQERYQDHRLVYDAKGKLVGVTRESQSGDD